MVAGWVGGGIAHTGILSLDGVRITSNTAQEGGGIYGGPGSVPITVAYLQNTVLSENVPFDCIPTGIESLGNNTDSDGSCSF